MPRSYNVNICRNYDSSINVMVLMKIGINISEKNERVYTADGNKFKTWVVLYKEDFNPDIYSYDNLKFRVIVYIWYNDLALYTSKTRGLYSVYSQY